MEMKRNKSMRVHTRATPKSSHPDADPGLVPSEAAIDAPTQEDFSSGQESRKPIVSIHGQDVDDEKAA